MAQPSEDNQRHERNTRQARQGVTLGHVRYVLGIGIALVGVLFAVIYFAGP